MFSSKRSVITFTVTTLVIAILGALLLFFATYHNVSPVEVQANLGITKDDALDIQKLAIKK